MRIAQASGTQTQVIATNGTLPQITPPETWVNHNIYIFVYINSKFNLNTDGCTSEVYQKSDGSCACGFFLEVGLTWSQAVDQCKAFGARLPEIHTPAENADIYNIKVNNFVFAIITKGFNCQF